MRSATRLALSALTVTSLLAGACGATTIDYVDFVQFGGIQYVAPRGELGRPLTEADLGPERFRVRQTLSRGGSGAGYRPGDGDAAFVATGDPVYTVRGYAPSFRLAARHDGRLVLYEADSNDSARQGADLLDIEGRVAAITLLSERDGRTVLGRIDDPARVRDLVHLVVTAPVDQSARVDSPPAAFIGFEMADGTTTARAYFVTAGVLSRGIKVGGTFRDAVNELLAAAPTPTPRPAAIDLSRRYDLARATRVYLKGLPGSIPTATPSVEAVARALDADLMTVDPPQPLGTYVVVGLEFTDHYVSFAYEADSGRLTVMVPEDRISVIAPDAFRALLATR